MDYSAAMRFVQRVGNLRTIFQNLIERERTFFEPAGEGFAVDALHHEIIRLILLADIEEHANVRMIQAGNGFCYTLEALFPRRIRRELGGKNLAGYGAV